MKRFLTLAMLAILVGSATGSMSFFRPGGNAGTSSPPNGVYSGKVHVRGQSYYVVGHVKIQGIDSLVPGTLCISFDEASLDPMEKATLERATLPGSGYENVEVGIAPEPGMPGTPTVRWVDPLP